jgi:cell division protein FtsN
MEGAAERIPYRLEQEGFPPSWSADTLVEEADLEETAATLELPPEEPVELERIPSGHGASGPAASTDSTTRRPAGIALQVLATHDRARAERVRERLRAELGRAVEVVQEGGWFKVRVTGLESREAARQLQRRLEKRYPGAWIVLPKAP